jgi:hypothetical protein
MGLHVGGMPALPLYALWLATQRENGLSSMLQAVHNSLALGPAQLCRQRQLPLSFSSSFLHSNVPTLTLSALLTAGLRQRHTQQQQQLAAAEAVRG